MNPKQQRLRALERQIARLGARLNEWEKTSRQLATARLISAFAALVAGILALTLEDSLPYWIVTAVLLAIFSVFVVLHARLKRWIDAFEGWRRIKRAHVARMTLDWAGMPPAPNIDPIPDHPFEIDLDITGEFSLHRLLDTAVSREGSGRLRGWLLATAPDLNAIQKRQALVSELRSLPIFRDKLALYGASRGTWGAAQAMAWLEGKPLADRRAVLALLLFAVVNWLLVLGDAFGILPGVWRLSIPAYFLLFLFLARGMGDIFSEALAARDTVEKLDAVFRYLESYPYGDHPNLKRLCAPFLDRSNRPSAQLARIRRVLFAASLRSNLFLWLPLNLILPWDMLVASGLDSARARLRGLMPGWLDAWAELEALCALANYAYLNPEATFPTVDAKAEACFEGKALGHLLIRDEVKVRNDFTLDGLGKVVIITGSNMAGKSSFLRTLGLTLCMAYAGGVVDAAAARISPFRLFTCIRVSDSVTEGFSYFYAEVRRLRALLDALNAPHAYPLFFLIDEIFKGTNNRERLIGSRAYIRALAGERGIGAISTHDLELVRLADELPSVSNAHFREEVIDGNMVFDYTLRQGPSPTTNALKIMELAGLPVGEDFTAEGRRE
jgi:hypothetical protein